MKKMFLISLAALACLSTACSDDDDKRCTAGFSECDKDILLTCSADNRIQKTQCPTTCSVINGVAACDKTDVGPGPVEGCGDVDEVGKCVGNTVYFCEANQLKSQDCGDKVCGLNSKNLYDCVDKQVGPGPGPGPQDGCGDVDEKGKCDGNKALVCKNGKLETLECKDGKTCGTRNDGQVDCLAAAENPCGEINAHGVCENNVITYCGEGPELKTIECTDNELCDLDTHQDYVCVKKVVIESDKCGDIDTVGKCDGQKVLYCADDNKLVSMTCNDDEECALHDGVYNCVPKGTQPQDPKGCGDIDAIGKCDGNVLSYCGEGDIVVTETCGKEEKCGKDPDGKNNCISKDFKDCGDVDGVGKCDGNTLSYCDAKKGLVTEACGKNQKCDKDTDGNYNCMDDDPTPKECGDVNAYGKCDKGNVIYCDENNLLATIKCTSNETCDKDEDGFYWCFKNVTEEASNCTSLEDTYKGACDGQKVLLCSEDEKLVSYMCNDDEKCIYVPTDGYYDCVENILCGDIKAVGKCDGNVLSYCTEEKVLFSYDCGEGYTCGMNTEENFYDCLKNADPDACGDVDKKGSCKDGKAIYCGDDDKLHTDTCTDAQECKADDAGNFRCVNKAPVDPCEGIDAKGKCDGNKATYCEANVLKTDTCTDAQECKADDAGNFRCVNKAPVDPCEGIDAKGKCDGNKAIYCDANELKTDTCTDAQECKADDAGNFRCVAKAPVDPDACGDVDKKGSCKEGKAVYCGDDNKLHTDECTDAQECKADDAGNFRCVAKE